jgi:membrane carboxypeptidase/penicillin-binding protein PbpC
VGHNRRFAVGVWVGRFSGTGDVGFLGVEAAEPLLASLFDLPDLRCGSDPPPASLWAVGQALPRPPEVDTPLRIVAPGEGATFLAASGARAVVHPRVSRSGAELSWFLIGSPLSARDAVRLLLPPGRYELRCVAPAGEASAVRFAVR